MPALGAARAEASFVGMVDLVNSSLFERLAVEPVESPVGERHDGARIRAWAAGPGAKLQ